MEIVNAYLTHPSSYHLHTLVLDHNPLDNSGVSALSQALVAHSEGISQESDPEDVVITKLSLHNCEVSDEGFVMLFTKLLLYFDHTDMYYNITGSFMELDISDNTIKSTGTIELLGRLFSDYNNISRLSLAQTKSITANMLLVLLEALKSNYSLLEIDFTSNPIAKE